MKLRMKIKNLLVLAQMYKAHLNMGCSTVEQHAERVKKSRLYNRLATATHEENVVEQGISELSLSVLELRMLSGVCEHLSQSIDRGLAGDYPPGTAEEYRDLAVWLNGIELSSTEIDPNIKEENDYELTLNIHYADIFNWLRLLPEGYTRWTLTRQGHMPNGVDLSLGVLGPGGEFLDIEFTNNLEDDLNWSACVLLTEEEAELFHHKFGSAVLSILMGKTANQLAEDLRRGRLSMFDSF